MILLIIVLILAITGLYFTYKYYEDVGLFFYVFFIIASFMVIKILDLLNIITI